MKNALTFLTAPLLALPAFVASAQTSAYLPKGEPTNTAEAAAQKAKADAVIEERYQALVAKLPPDQQAWERVLQSQLGGFYLPLHKRAKIAGQSTAWDFVQDDPKLPRVLLIGDSVSRGYLNGIPGKGDWFRGFYIGSDGFSPTRTFFSKNSVTQGLLEVQRQWYTFMLWGRLAYNPATSDTVFKNYMALKYPEVPAENLFAAWSKGSRGLPKATELVHGTLKLDFHWWAEACQSRKGFVTAIEFADAIPGKGSTLCSIAQSASNRCDGGKSSYALADEIEADAVSALSMVNPMSAAPNTELGVTINNIKAMSYLTIYYAYKIRGATWLKANDKEKARNSLGTAYCWWMKYSNLMNAMFTGMAMQRSADLPDWHAHDKSVLKEYTDLGGTGIPSCEEKTSK